MPEEAEAEAPARINAFLGASAVVPDGTEPDEVVPEPSDTPEDEEFVVAPDRFKDDPELLTANTRELRWLAKRAPLYDEAQERIAQAQREQALLLSGIDFDSSAGKLLKMNLLQSEAWKTSVPTVEELKSTARFYGVGIRGES
jgi:hypothetical protein